MEEACFIGNARYMRSACPIDSSAVLIATLGTEPQVVTAALDVLTWQGENISRVIVIHTFAPNTPIDAAIKTLQRAFSAMESGPILKLVLIRDEQGRPFQDVETPPAAQAAFRAIYNQVRLSKLDGARVHLSIAGGRKTMTIYGMLAAQLLFDDHDHLWHLYSGGEFLASKRLHPQPGDQVHLIPIPVVQWSNISPMLLDLANIEDPYEALKHQENLRLNERLEDMRAFVRGSLTPAEARVVALLVTEGLSDQEIATRLSLSTRTVEQHLRSAYSKAAAHWGLSDVNRTQLVRLLSLYYIVSR